MLDTTSLRVSAAKTNMVMIAVAPTVGPRGRQGYFDARLGDGRVLGKPSKQPFVDAARRLLDLGNDPTTVLVMRHAGSDTDCMTAQIGVAAKLRVKEDRRGPRFIKWEPISRRVEALVSAKAKKASRVASAHANEPSARPGAETTTQSSSAPRGHAVSAAGECGIPPERGRSPGVRRIKVPR